MPTVPICEPTQNWHNYEPTEKSYMEDVKKERQLAEVWDMHGGERTTKVSIRAYCLKFATRIITLSPLCCYMSKKQSESAFC